MSDVRTLAFQFVGKDVSASKTFDKLSHKADETHSKIGKMGKGLAVASAATAAAVAGAVVGLGAFAKSSIGAFESAGKSTLALQRVMGGTAEQVSRIGSAAKSSGVGADTLGKGMRILSKHLAAGDKAAQSMGIAYKDAHGKMKPMDQILIQLGDKFKNMPNGIEKTAAAQKLFGKSGTDLLPFLNKGSAGIKELMDRSDRLGTTLSGKNLTDLKKYVAAQREWHQTIDGVKIRIGSVLMPLLVKFASFMTGTLQKAIKAVTPIVHAFTSAFSSTKGGGISGFFAKIRAGINNAWPVLKAGLKRLGSLLWQWIGPQIIPAIQAGIKFFGRFQQWVWTVAYPSIARAMARLGVALYNWIAPRVVPALQAAGRFVARIGAWIGSVGAPRLWAWLQRMGAQLVAWIGPRIEPARNAIARLVGRIGDWIKSTGGPALGHWLVAMGAKLIGWIGPRIPGMLLAIGKFLGRLELFILGGIVRFALIMGQLGLRLIAWIGPRIPGALAAIGRFLGRIGAWILTVGLPKLGGWLVSMGAKLIAWIAPRIPGVVAAIGRFIGRVGTWILTVGIPRLIGWLAAMGLKLILWIAPRIPAMIIAITRFVARMGQWILTVGVPRFLAWLARMGIELIKWIIPRIPGMLAAMARFLASIVSWVTTKGIPTLIRKTLEWGKKAVNSLVSGFKSVNVGKVLGDFVSGAFNKVKGVVSGAVRWIVNKPILKLLEILRNVAGWLSLDGPRKVLSTAADAANRFRGFSRGGYVDGPGTGTSDSIPARLSKGEYVVNAKAAERNRAMLERINAQGGKTNAAGEEIGAGKGGGGGGSGADSGVWRRMWAVVKAQFPGQHLHSAFRPGARTHASGAVSYHASGRAIDIDTSTATFNWIKSKYGSSIRELISSQMGGAQVKNGQNHMYSGVTRADHFNHIHWAMQSLGGKGGGIIGNITGVFAKLLSKFRDFVVKRAGGLIGLAGGVLNPLNNIPGLSGGALKPMLKGIVNFPLKAIKDKLMAIALGKDKAEQTAANASSGGGIQSSGGNATGTMLGNARIIATVGKQMGLPRRAWQIAIMAALVESGLINLHYGDRDSQGLFQMRPSMGWGTPAQVTNPVYASRKFYSVLKGVGWEHGDMGAAAQAVERSGFPGRYAQHQAQADHILTQLGFKYGTNYVPATGRYTLHQGEAVIPAKQNKAGGGTVVNIDMRGSVGLDKRALARAVIDALEDRRRGGTRSVVLGF